jgi:acetyl esterase/lipase
MCYERIRLGAIAHVSGCARFLFFTVLIFPSALSLAQRVSILDTIYTPSGYPEGPLTASIFVPSVHNGAGVILCHGISAARHQMDVWCDSLAAHGFVAMTIDYYDINNRTSGGYPKPVRAFKSAVQFLRSRAARFGISPDKIAGLGLSQGSIVWGETIVWDNDYAYFGTDPSVDDGLDAVVLLYGLFDNAHFLTSAAALESWLAQYFSSAPALRQTKGNCIVNVANITTPVLLIHGTKDVILQYQQSKQLFDSLSAHQKVCQLELFNGQGHEFDLNSTEDAFTAIGLVVKDTVVHFLQRILGIPGVASAGPFAAGQLYPSEYGLVNYPNPFNSSTVIEFTLPKEAFVTLEVYDVLGRRVAGVENGNEGAGTHRMVFTPNGLPSGFYILRMQTPDFEGTKKLIYLK